MKNESGFKKKAIKIELFGTEIEVMADGMKFALCEEIKATARDLLEKINGENIESQKANSIVEEFLLESIEKLLGESNTKSVFTDREATIPELTGVLCRVISELGMGFEPEEEVPDDEV